MISPKRLVPQTAEHQEGEPKAGAWKDMRRCIGGWWGCKLGFGVDEWGGGLWSGFFGVRRVSESHSSLGNVVVGAVGKGVECRFDKDGIPCTNVRHFN